MNLADLPLLRPRLAARPALRPASPFVAQARATTPLGPVTLVATARGLAGLWFDDQKHHPGGFDLPTDARHPHVGQAIDELTAYWSDGNAAFRVPLDPQGSAFQQAVWRALQAIGAGSTLSYGALAASIGRPEASRAVGAAVGRNPVSVVLPCHRVLGGQGRLTGYAGGLERKTWLLAHEGVAPGARR